MGANRQSFLVAFMHVQDELRAACHAICGDAHVADDLFQEMALAGWQSFDQFDPERATFSAWMRGILRHVHANHWRRRDRQMPLLAPASVQQILLAMPEEPAKCDDRIARLRHCLGRLSRGVRSLFLWRYRDELSRAEMAQRSGKSEAAVKKALYRGRLALQACMERSQ